MSKGILILGAGGHASVCIDILRTSGKKIAYCLDTSDSPRLGRTIDGIEVIEESSVQSLFESGHTSIFIAIGDNSIRNHQQIRLADLGFTFERAVSTSALISNFGDIGSGVAIMPGAVINAGAKVGDHSIINSGAVVEHDCQISEFVHVGPNSTLTGNVIVGARTLIGAGSVVIPGVRIGSDVIVGAGSVVINDVPSSSTVFGNPAKAH
jgi:UDP-perosamine 4-acetyltransferase